MPELPEVETVVRDLRPLLTGHTITGVRQSKHKLRGPWKPAWNSAVTGARIEGIRRRGKWILIDLRSQKAAGKGKAARPLAPVLRIHLGMTGQFTVVSMPEPEQDHVHVVFGLGNEYELRLRDPRRFGSAEFFPDRTALDAEMNAELGPEPFDIDGGYFHAAIARTKRNLKAILLDQTILAGVGNIYADEACFRAELHPGRTGASLSPEECDRLRGAIAAVLTKAVDSRGSTIRDYIGGSGLRGGFQNEFAVYGRKGKPCPVCTRPIESARHAGRASHYCPSCQPFERKRKSRRTAAGPARP